MMHMRILLVNQYAGSPTLGMEFRPHWMATNWERMGHEVLVVAGTYSHLRRKHCDPGVTEVEGIRYLFLPTTRYEINGTLRAANIVSFRRALSLASRRLTSWSPDVVIASSTHPLDVRPSLKIARRSRAAFVYEVHDLWPLTPILMGGLPRNHPFAQWMKREEMLGYQNCDLAVSLLPNTKEYMVALGLPEDRWAWIPNGIDVHATEESPPERVVNSIQQVRHGGRRVLIYAGTLGEANGLERLLSHASYADSIGLSLAVLGDGPLKHDLVSRFCKENVTFLEALPRSQVNQVLRLCDAAYIGLKPSPLWQFGVSPNKLYDYMNAGVAVLENIGAPNSPTAEAGAGWAVTPSDPTALRSALREVAACSPALLEEMGERGRSYVLSGFRQESLAEKVLASVKSRETMTAPR